MLEMYTHQNMGNEEERKDDAVRSIKAGVFLIGDILKSTLGPKGSLKILKSEKSINVTNDGAFILKNLLIESPSARILVDSSINQDFEEGDGTTSIAVLTSLILKYSYELNIHPTKIIKGLSMALSKSNEILEKKKFSASEADILNLVKTTLNSKILVNDLDLFAKICVNAVSGLRKNGEIDIKLINIIKLDGDLKESFLMDGIVLEKDLILSDRHISNEDPRNEKGDLISSKESSNKSPNEISELTSKIENIKLIDYNRVRSNSIVNPRILLANTSLDADKVKIFTTKATSNSILELSKIEDAEKERMKSKIDSICAHQIDLFINRQIIYDYPQQLFIKSGVSFIENTDFENIERLQKVLGGTIVSHFSTEEKTKDDNVLTACELVESIRIKDKNLTKFTCKDGCISTIILHGSSQAVLDEAERSIHDALCVLKRIYESSDVIYGGGNIEVTIAQELLKYSQTIKTKESDVIVAFSNALMDIPKIIIDNCGFDGDNIKNLLKSKFSAQKNCKNFTHGVDVTTGLASCMRESKILEGFEMKKRVISAACETAQAILKVDGIVKCAPRERSRH